MIRGLYTSAAGMMVQRERQNIISNNLANSNTTGFKKDQTIIQEFPEFELYRKDDEKLITPFENSNKLSKIGKLGTGAQVKDVKPIYEQGNLKLTGNTLDFGIEGDGFFAVRSENGVRLTRNGSANINREGILVNKNGEEFLSVNNDGQIGTIVVNGSDFELSEDGEIINGELNEELQANQNIVGEFPDNLSMLVVDIDDKNYLEKEGYNNYKFDENAVLNYDNNSGINQGMLEESTVNTVTEMVEMINCARSYETNQKVLSSHDAMLDKAVNQVGKWT